MRSNLIIRGLKTSVAILPLLAGGCGWYMDMSNSIGSHMPTYEGWFGDEKPKQQNNNANYQPDPYSYGAPPPSGVQQPAPPRGAAMPQGYYQTERLPAGQQQPVYGMPPSYTPPSQMPPPDGMSSAYGAPNNGPAADQGLREMQMRQQMQQPAPYGQQPLPYGQQMQQPFMSPAIPFTQPDLVQPEVQVQEQSGTIQKELPSDLPPTIVVQQEQPKPRGTFAFFDDISEVVGGWFGDSEAEKKPYPNLATVPPTQDYTAQHESMQRAEQELLADRAVAESKQREITDWSQLADAAPASAAPIVQPNVIASPSVDQPIQTIAPQPEAMMAAPVLTPPSQAAVQVPQQAAQDDYTVLERKLLGEQEPQRIKDKSWYSGWDSWFVSEEKKPLTEPQPMPEQAMIAPAPQAIEPQQRIANPVPPSQQTVVYRNENIVPQPQETVVYRNENVAPVVQPQESFIAPPPAPPAMAKDDVKPVIAAPEQPAPQIYMPQPIVNMPDVPETNPEYLRQPEVVAEQGFLPASRYAARRAAERQNDAAAAH